MGQPQWTSMMRLKVKVEAILVSSFTDPKADGKKNLHYLHELVR